MLCRLEEGGVVTTCRLNNMITDAPITLDISQAPLAYKLIMKVLEMTCLSTKLT
jgi:hypothetical protein